MSYYTKLIFASLFVLAFTLFAALWNDGIMAEGIMILLALVLWPPVIFLAPLALVLVAILFARILMR